MSTTKRLSKTERRNRRIRVGISIAAIAVLLLIAAVLFFQKKVSQNFASSNQEILSAKVSTGSISTIVSGSGTLVSDGITDVMIRLAWKSKRFMWKWARL